MLYEDADRALRAAIWRRFARLDGYSPVHCTFTPRRKIVFDTPEAAVGAAAELTRLDGVLRYVHSCGSHWHTTRSRQREPDWKELRMAESLGKMIKKIEKANKSGGKTAWSASKPGRTSDDKCKGCRVKYSDMGAGTFKAHQKAWDAGDHDCPDT